MGCDAQGRPCGCALQPLAGMGAWGQDGPGMGDLIVYDSEVHAKKDEVNQDVKNLSLTAGGCVDGNGQSKLTVDEQMSLNSFRAEWFAFYTKPIPFWGASEEMATTLRYQQRAIAWRNDLSSRCELVGPVPLPPPEKPPGPTELASEWIGMLKIAIPAAAVIAVAVLAAPFVLEYAGARKSRP
jgi:hypothetical protein